MLPASCCTGLGFNSRSRHCFFFQTAQPLLEKRESTGKTLLPLPFLLHWAFPGSLFESPTTARALTLYIVQVALGFTIISSPASIWSNPGRILLSVYFGVL